MATYQIEIVKSAQKELDALDRTMRKRVLSSIAKLGTEPRPSGCKKLVGADDRYRIRVGSYRVVYVVDDARVLVLVLSVGHRREVYR